MQPLLGGHGVGLNQCEELVVALQNGKTDNSFLEVLAHNQLPLLLSGHVARLHITMGTYANEAAHLLVAQDKRGAEAELPLSPQKQAPDGLTSSH